MSLVAYSDSEASDHEAVPAPKQAQKPAAAQPKRGFQKVVDRSNPHKIRVNLPAASAASTEKDDVDGEAPPAKKARTGGGAFSGFNALLPAPKRTGGQAASGAAGGSGGAKKGLGVGISLRTGAAPAFSREPVSIEASDSAGAGGRHAVGEEPSADEPKQIASDSPFAAHIKPQEVKLVGKPTVFRPLSVARNTKKKKPAQAVVAPSSQPENAVKSVAVPIPKPRVSLFSIAQTETEPTTAAPGDTYTPMLYEDNREAPASEPHDHADFPDIGQTGPVSATATHHTTSTSNAATGPQSLDTIAADLNLTEAQRRQLFGRQRGKAGAPDLAAINVVSFNTDEEYAANEALRATGETIQHNPVRAIAPGKHSLKQLVNAAQTQKDALEEHFAAGRRNKKEAGSRYGW